MQEKNDVKEEVAVSDSAVLNGSFSSSSDDVLSPSVGIKRKYFYNFIKRVFDIVSSGLVLIVVSWLILLCMLIKWLEDAKNSAYELEIIERESADAPKPKKAKRYVRADGKVVDCILKPRKKERGEKIKKSPIYASTRVGKDGKEFNLYKFRSMYQDAEVAGARWAEEGDPRVTPFGKFLRNKRLDEIPQFWNVVRGDMSLIGPRPERPMFHKVFCERIDGWEQRLAVKPGITGLAQVEGGYSLLPKEKAQFDIQYIESRNLRLDCAIVIKTIQTMIYGRGAR